jgi:HEAT repeat protein
VRQWTDRLRDADKAWRLRAATVLGSLGLRAQLAMPALTMALDDPAPEVRRVVVASLREVTPDLRQTFAAILQAAQDPDDIVRRRAIRLLGELGPDALAAVPVLVNTLRDRNPLIRRYAASALGDVGPGAVQAISPLIAALSDTDVRNRVVIVVALGRMGPRVVPRLVEALHHIDPILRAGAARALARHPRGGDAIPFLQLLLTDPEPEVRATVVEALARLQEEKQGSDNV